jgi:hypothetical protein
MTVDAGLRYAALHEGIGYPSIILSLNGIFPTRDTTLEPRWLDSQVVSVAKPILIPAFGKLRY